MMMKIAHRAANLFLFPGESTEFINFLMETPLSESNKHNREYEWQHQ